MTRPNKNLYLVYRIDTKQWLVSDWVKNFEDAWGTFDKIRKGVISTRPQDAAAFISDITSPYSDRYGRYGMKPFPKEKLTIVQIVVAEPFNVDRP